MERYDSEEKPPVLSKAQDINLSGESFSQLDFYLKTKTLHHEAVGVSQKLVFDDTIKSQSETATPHAGTDEKPKPAKTIKTNIATEHMTSKAENNKKHSIERTA